MFSARMAYCGPRGIPLSKFLAWSEEDQQAALAWQSHENQRCSGCGTHPDDWVENKTAFHPEITQCLGCIALDRTRETSEYNNLRAPGLRLVPGTEGDCSRCSPHAHQNA